MGFPGYRRSIRASLAYLGMAAATASALVVLQNGVAFAADAITVIPDSGSASENAITVLEGVNTGSKLVGKFTDTGNALPDVNCSELYVATINWGDGTSSTGTVTCERDTSSDHVPTGIFDVTDSHTYADSASESITVSVVDNSESAESSGAAVKTDTALVADQPLDAGSASNVTQVEGGTTKVTATFNDRNNAYSTDEGVDPGLKATIDWGDGSTVTNDIKIAWNDSGHTNVQVTGSHVYDANTPATKAYSVKVTLKDDGVEVQAADTLTATISDAALTAGTAKSVVMTGAQASTVVVASFADAAKGQASAADFTTTVKWGDGANSAGTVAQTAAGAFNVSGTHTYATAGTKALTITVTDQEGQKTLSMTATVTVPALPTTGQPTIPVTPASTPLLPLLALGLGLMAIAGGVGRVLIRRARS
jgi:hypothetical protein